MMIMMVESSQWRLLTRKSCALSGSIWMQLRSVQTRQRLHETCSKCRAKSNLCVCVWHFSNRAPKECNDHAVGKFEVQRCGFTLKFLEPAASERRTMVNAGFHEQCLVK